MNPLDDAAKRLRSYLRAAPYVHVGDDRSYDRGTGEAPHRWLTDTYLAVDLDRPAAAVARRMMAKALGPEAWTWPELPCGPYLPSSGGKLHRPEPGHHGLNLGAIIDQAVRCPSILEPWTVPGTAEHGGFVDRNGDLSELWRPAGQPAGAVPAVALARHRRIAAEEAAASTGSPGWRWAYNPTKPLGVCALQDPDGHLAAVLMPVRFNRVGGE